MESTFAHAKRSNDGALNVSTSAPAPSLSVRTERRLPLSVPAGGTAVGSKAGSAASCASRQPEHTCMARLPQHRTSSTRWSLRF